MTNAAVRWITAIFALVENILLAGSVIGWAAIIFIYEKEGVYSKVCPRGM